MKSPEESTKGVDFWILGELWILGFKVALELWILARLEGLLKGQEATTLITCPQLWILATCRSWLLRLFSSPSSLYRFLPALKSRIHRKQFWILRDS